MLRSGEKIFIKLRASEMRALAPIFRVEHACAILIGTLLPRFARHAVVPRWIRFISAFPARRLVQRQI